MNRDIQSRLAFLEVELHNTKALVNSLKEEIGLIDNKELCERMHQIVNMSRVISINAVKTSNRIDEGIKYLNANAWGTIQT